MQKKTITDDVYNRLRQMIFSNSLKSRERLLERDLAQELDVSRTPVREAISRLEKDGLVHNIPGKGYFVVEMSAKQVDDLYDLREILEAHAVRLAAERASPADLEELDRVLLTLAEYRKDPAKRGDEIKAGLRIHEIIARASGNGFLHDIVVSLLERMYFFIWMDVLAEDSEAAELTHREHLTLLALIREKQSIKAEELIRTHTRRAKLHILKLITARETFYQQITSMPVLSDHS